MSWLDALVTSRHVKTLFFLHLSIVLLPFDTAVIVLLWLWSRVTGYGSIGPQKTLPAAQRKTVLITSVGTTQGLTLARLFHRAGHRVIGADTEPLSVGAVSQAVHRHYALARPPANTPLPKNAADSKYIGGLLRIVRAEGVDLCISASDDAHMALHDALACDVIRSQTFCKAVHSGVDGACTLGDRALFMDLAHRLRLPVPDFAVVRSREQLVETVEERGGQHGPGLDDHDRPPRQYLVKPLGVDDDGGGGQQPLLLPRPTRDETKTQVAQLPLPLPLSAMGERAGHNTPAVLVQEFVPGHEYCSHAVVIRGQVRAFAACPSSSTSDVMTHYTLLPTGSAHHAKMLAFTRRVAAHFGERFSGHLGFDFRSRLFLGPDKLHPRAHTAAVLFSHTPALVDEYLSLLLSEDAPPVPSAPLTPSHRRYYWMGQDLFDLVLRPWLSLARVTTNGQLAAQLDEGWASARLFASHVASWKDATLEPWDPLPAWWLYHVFWPARFIRLWRDGQRWSRVNVSTGRVYKA
ncbi:hypothetical protein B0T26DRAFT_650928 [Lasiosphaeria miniovina]|uniref:ATP-grasp domain-containing protein n=1 Tax=Lasiosphaeria miniovina TaxID=1954250 RepID=A0AA40DVP1_9PEZI|nr:uncharacterized protein B0T26DRAFT_650928 [Lasiosphaeria miniovina]KAK0713463.1 hypothetical protein B0T26DRAFT_650928 [Lasiosphaeria miniovina]